LLDGLYEEDQNFHLIFQQIYFLVLPFIMV
jgi:hypothetical protein